MSVGRGATSVGPRLVIPQYDAVIVGAGMAGLSAALVLGRSRRWVLLLDGGEPRNAPAAGAHGFFTRDGVSPRELLEIGRDQLAPYRSVEHRVATAMNVSGSDGAFEVFLDDGSMLTTRKLLLATGVEDELPETPGFRELWGRGVYHCPYCHGWEVRDRPLAVYAAANDPVGIITRAVLLRNWSRDLAVVTDGPSGLNAGELAKLNAMGVAINEKVWRVCRDDQTDRKACRGSSSPTARRWSAMRCSTRRRNASAPASLRRWAARWRRSAMRPPSSRRIR